MVLTVLMVNSVIILSRRALEALMKHSDITLAKLRQDVEHWVVSGPLYHDESGRRFSRVVECGLDYALQPLRATSQRRLKPAWRTGHRATGRVVRAASLRGAVSGGCG